MKQNRFTVPLMTTVLFSTLLLFVSANPSQASIAPSFGSSNNFVLFTSAGLANSGASTISGDIVNFPNISYVDSGSISLNGSYHFGDATAVATSTSPSNAYLSVSTSAPATQIAGDLSGQTFSPGTYVNPVGLGLSGTVTLDGKGDPNSVFIFQSPSVLSTAAASHINLVNGVQACNVFWQSAGTANLGANSDFKGNLLSNSNVIVGNSSTVLGRVIALHGSVSLSADTITKPNCVVVSKVPSKINGLPSGNLSYLPNTMIPLVTTVSPKSGSAVCTGSVLYSVDRNPITGVVGSFAVVSPINTANWQIGIYHLTATYPGDALCLPSTATVDVKIGSTTQTNISGGGSYGFANNRASFSLSLKNSISANPQASTVTGKVNWELRKSWRFQGVLNTWVVANNVNTATGTGNLWYFNAKNHGNKWVQATLSPTTVTVNFTTNTNSVSINGSDNRNSRSITSFAIGFNGTSAAGIPSLPALSALANVGGGKDD